ncbi:GNAT family N-acetyltransferase [Streptomyces sp. NPDC048639]|uniref:GNAT family N-acetyltransferase n=1 Tax=Streptomyces sp. NPDC048639 TaxID=3365581 RepID=UPI003714C95D
MKIRQGGTDDIPAILTMLDRAVAWLVEEGRTGQWGTEPWSTRPRGAEKVAELVRSGTPWLAEVDGVPAGTLVLAPHPSDPIPRAEEPEVFVRLLVTDRRYAGHGVGSALLAHAVEEARRQAISLVRVDCYAGGGGRLVDYYQRNGFTPTETMTIGEWPGQLLEQRVL